MQNCSKLLEMGLDAYGVDIDPGPIENAYSVLKGRGEEPEKRLICIDADYRTPFTDGFFNVIISDQVFEHVHDLEALAAELARIASISSVGLHNFPAKWRVTEPHLFIPFVHWLPKNWIRYWYLRLQLNRIPVWKGLEKGSTPERVQVYFDYSVQKTYYRPLRMVIQTLRKYGFKVRIHATGRPGRRIKLCFPFLFFNNKLSSKFWTWHSTNFREVELATFRY